MQFELIEGTTPINPDEAEGLIPKNIFVQNELNEWEQANIVEAEIWLFRQKQTLDKFLTIDFIRKFHQKMFNKTWQWAGQFRISDKNIGGCWTRIPFQLRNLCDDVIYQVQNKVYPIDEIAIRFHHRLVSIHCFPNGNGRHARILTDYFLQIVGYEKFTWGSRELTKATEARKHYITALKEADKGKYGAL